MPAITVTDYSVCPDCGSNTASSTGIDRWTGNTVVIYVCANECGWSKAVRPE